MCEKQTRASFWQNAKKLETDAVKRLGLPDPVMVIAWDRSGMVGVHHENIDQQQQECAPLLTPIDAEEIKQRLECQFSWIDEYQGFAIPTWSSRQSAFLVLALKQPFHHDVVCAGLYFPPS